MVIHSIYNYISVFSGGGGLDLAVQLAVPKARCVCHVEIEVSAAALLASRMAEGSLDEAPIWSNAQTFDGRPWRSRVGGIIAGFPCPDYSVAGQRKGITGEHGQLWYPLASIIREVGPSWIFLENVPGILNPHRNKETKEVEYPAGIDFVLGDLAEMGFDAEWGCVSAAAVGASHKRERWWCLAYSRRLGDERWRRSPELVCAPGAPEEDRQEWERCRESVGGGGLAVATSTRRGLGELRERSGRDGLADGSQPALGDTYRERFREGQRWTEVDRAANDGENADIRHAPPKSVIHVGDAERSGCEESVASSRWAHATQDTAGVDDRPGRPGGAVGNTLGAGLEEWRCERGDDGAECAAAERASVPFFPPGPGLAGAGAIDDILKLYSRSPEAAWLRYQAELRNTTQWADLLVRYPWMRPALAQAEAQSVIHGDFDGMAGLVADTRTDALRAAGNGAVALAGAAALRGLLRRIS